MEIFTFSKNWMGLSRLLQLSVLRGHRTHQIATKAQGEHRPHPTTQSQLPKGMGFLCESGVRCTVGSPWSELTASTVHCGSCNQHLSRAGGPVTCSNFLAIMNNASLFFPPKHKNSVVQENKFAKQAGLPKMCFACFSFWVCAAGGTLKCLLVNVQHIPVEQILEDKHWAMTEANAMLVGDLCRVPCCATRGPLHIPLHLVSTFLLAPNSTTILDMAVLAVGTPPRSGCLLSYPECLPSLRALPHLPLPIQTASSACLHVRPWWTANALSYPVTCLPNCIYFGMKRSLHTLVLSH